MGGNALKNTVTRRFLADEYHQIGSEVMDILINEFDGCHIIQSYHDKESFGDLDILYTSYEDKSMSVDSVKRLFNPNEIVRNGSVISFDYKEMQVDLIFSPTEEFDYALSYFSWNDAGNLVGKLAHQMGLRHGHAGLFLPLRDGNHQFGNIRLTIDHDETLELLGLDKDKFTEGFDNLDQIFNWIAKSDFYNPEWYKLENLNSVAKIRDRKRDTYNKFLEFGERWRGPVFGGVKDKDTLLLYVLRFFGGAEEQFKKIVSSYTLEKSANLRFNGCLVSIITGLKEKELGDFMKYIKNTDQIYPEMVMYMTDDQIKKKIENIYEFYVLP